MENVTFVNSSKKKKKKNEQKIITNAYTAIVLIAVAVKVCLI